MDYKLEILVWLAVACVVILLGITVFQLLAKKEPEVERKWTDPANRR